MEWAIRVPSAPWEFEPAVPRAAEAVAQSQHAEARLALEPPPWPDARVSRFQRAADQNSVLVRAPVAMRHALPRPGRVIVAPRAKLVVSDALLGPVLVLAPVSLAAEPQERLAEPGAVQ